MPRMTERPFISFLTDFGAASSAPAVCRGVMLGIAPDARLVDITHAIRQFAVRDGAFLLARSVPYFPVGVHVAVVDPGVGTPRRPVALRAARGDLLVGPDNGLLLPAAEVLGGIEEVRTLQNRALWLPTVSNTFHGRDIFSPVGARLATGTALADVGPLLDPAELVRFPMPVATLRNGGLDTSVLFIDAFGNCRLAGETADLTAAAGNLTSGRIFDLVLAGGDGRPPRRRPIPWVATFGEVPAGEPLLFEDADYAGPSLAVNQGSAAEHFGLALDDAVRLEPT